MPRLAYPSQIAQAPKAAQTAWASVEKRFGFLPNLYRLFALSPAALKGFIGLSRSLDRAKLPAATRRRISLAVSEFHSCGYCLSANTFVARASALLDDAEITANRSGSSNDLKAEAAVRFALAVARERGKVRNEQLAEVREAGYTDREILEIVMQVGLTTLTNYANEVAETETDFPRVSVRSAPSTCLSSVPTSSLQPRTRS